MSRSSDGGDAWVCAFIEVGAAGGAREPFGAAIDADIVTAPIIALVGAIAPPRELSGRRGESVV